MKTQTKGSMTVEAAMILPIFISVILSVAFLIKVAYVHEIMQHAIEETANQMASSAYLYYVSGLQELNDSARDKVEDSTRTVSERLSTVLNLYSSFKEVTGINPTDGISSILDKVASEGFEDIKTQLYTPLLNSYISSHLGGGDTDKRLKGLNVVKGIFGLDFSDSRFFADESEDIDVIVSYRLRIPVPFKVLPDLVITQRACARAWILGDYPIAQGNEDDIWSLKNFQRGNKIRKAFNANLPENFPVISRFDSKTGTASMIKSMDLTMDSYKHRDAVKKKVQEYISKLAGYKGQEQPWGSKEIVIRQRDIRRKQLILVIPKNPLNPEIEDALATCVNDAIRKGITLRIERYGVKKTKENVAK